jgi:hypothetical protein
LLLFAEIAEVLATFGVGPLGRGDEEKNVIVLVCI